MIRVEDSQGYEAGTTVIMVTTAHVFLSALRFHGSAGGAPSWWLAAYWAVAAGLVGKYLKVEL